MRGYLTLTLALSIALLALQPVAGAERASRSSTKPAIFKLPRPVEATLKNGLKVLIVQNRLLPTVSVEMRIDGAGAFHESSRQSGVAKLTAAMIAEGARVQRGQRIAERLENLGASMEASAESTVATISASGLSTTFDRWFPMAMGALRRPAFPKACLTRLKGETATGLRMARANPSSLVRECFGQMVYGDHPAGAKDPSPESIEQIGTSKLRQWHRQRYAPQNATLAIVGDVSASELLPKLDRWIGSWKPNGYQPARLPDPAPAATAKLRIVDRKDSAQAVIQLGNIAIKRSSDDLFALKVLNQIVGGGSSSRLYQNLRQEKGWTYGAYSGFSTARFRGPWLAQTSVRQEVTADAVKELLREIGRVRTKKVGRAELQRAKSTILGGLAVSLDEPGAVLDYAIVQKYHGLPKNYWTTYQRRIAGVTAEEIQRVARRYLDPKTLQIAVVGDAQALTPSLSRLGIPIE